MCEDMIPNPDEFIRGFRAFRTNEPRDAMYKVATFLISHFWGHYTNMTNALGVLLLTWNQACYRYGSFSYDALEDCLRESWPDIETFRQRDIFSLSETDKQETRALFDKFLKALQIAAGKSQGRKSPVAVSKALHLLAPKFFPLWDDKIARGYSCHYSKHPTEKYYAFSGKIKAVAEVVSEYEGLPEDVTILKLIDEYNYAKYTKKWI
jgi:hypothetical protein